MTVQTGLGSVLNTGNYTTVIGWAQAQAYIEENNLGTYSTIKSDWDASPLYFNDGNEPLIKIGTFYIFVLGAV